MFMHKSKKGFTIVELVIVIAVIAILAAVLIPTFSNLVKKANQSADIQAARQMNTFLAADGAVEATTPGKLFDVLGEGGFDAKDYKALVKDHYFFWDRGLNQILYVDSNKNIIFPEGVTASADWYSLSGDFIGGESTITLPSAPSSNDEFVVASGADFIEAAEYIKQKATEYQATKGTIVIELTADIDLQGADLNFAQESTSEVDIIFKSDVPGTVRTIKNLYISDQHATIGGDSEGNTSNTYGHSLFNSVKNLTVQDIAIEYSVIGGFEASQGGFFAGQIYGNASFENVTVKNCDIQASRKVGVLAGYTHGTVEFKNVAIDSCNVTASQGEAGIVIGVMEVSKVSKNDTVVTGAVSVTNSTVNIANNTVKTVKDSSNNSYTVVEYVEDGNTKYRVATAKFAFYSVSNSPSKIDVTGDGAADLAAYPALDTLEAFKAAKGVK